MQSIHRHDVFLSYAHEDEDDALELINLLQERGVRVWWDRELIEKQRWSFAIESALLNARTVIVLWSPNSVQSDFVRDEARWGAKHEKLLQLVIKGAAVPLGFGEYQARFVKDFRAEILEILKAIAFDPLARGQPAEAGMILTSTERTPVRILNFPTTTAELFGRDTEMTRLITAWKSGNPGAPTDSKTNVLVLTGIGGAGKTALATRFLDQLAREGWAGAERVYGWSAYSQGAKENRRTSAETFLRDALKWFGHDLDVRPIDSHWDRGVRLAELVKRHRTLLVLDGIEPLQHLPDVHQGRLTDKGLQALLTQLADDNPGLCLVTSRQEIPEIIDRGSPRVISLPLDRLSKSAGVILLKHLGVVHGPEADFEKAVEWTRGHALTLNLLGTHLEAVYGGHIGSWRETVRGLADSEEGKDEDDEEDAGVRRANRVMASYERRLSGRVELDILSMVALFDRPVPDHAIAALRAAPPIAGLTDALTTLSLPKWGYALKRLRALRLINPVDPGNTDHLDAHPLVREYFATQLRQRKPDTFRIANERLYEHYSFWGVPEPVTRVIKQYTALKVIRPFVFRTAVPHMSGHIDLPPQRPAGVTSEEFDEVERALPLLFPNNLSGLQILAFAVAHGCAAGRFRETFQEVFVLRIQRGVRDFMATELGAKAEYLALLSNFFEEPFITPAKSFQPAEKLQLLNKAGVTLSALGRLSEATETMREAYRSYLQAKAWENAAIEARNLSGTLLALGRIPAALEYGSAAIAHADACEDDWWPAAFRAGVAHTLHQKGDFAGAKALFEEAEAIKQRRELPRFHILRAELAALKETAKTLDADSAKGLLARIEKREQYAIAYATFLHGLPGFNYCEFLLGRGQYQDVFRRTGLLLSAAEEGHGALGVALNHLFLGLAQVMALNIRGLEVTESAPADVRQIRERLDVAVDRLRKAADDYHLARGLLARASFLRGQGDLVGSERDLREAENIAGRSGMRLLSADSALERAKLCLDSVVGQEARSASECRKLARDWRDRAGALIGETGYNRRLPDLALISAHLELADGNLEEARHYLSSARAIIDQHQLESLRPELTKLAGLGDRSVANEVPPKQLPPTTKQRTRRWWSWRR